jgi:predicted Zn-dependent protease with MMP-like domain
MARQQPIILITFIFLSLFTSGCFKAIGDSLGAGFLSELNEDELQKILDKSSRTVIQSSMDEFLKDSIQQEFRASMDKVLAQTGDSINQISLQVVENFMGKYTEEWLEARTQQLSGQLTKALQDAKGELLNEDIENYMRNLSRNVIRAELNGLVTDLVTNLTSERTLARLSPLREALAVELDTLIQAAFRSAVSNYDREVNPRVDSLRNQANTVMVDADKTSRGIIKNLIWGVVGLILFVLAAFLAYSIIWQRRYKSMLAIITKNIDKINQQESYDQLTHAIRSEMSQQGLEKHLRTLLEEQELLEQEEWKDKDRQLLRLLSAELAKSQDSVDQMGPHTLESIRERAKALGLEDHLESVLSRISQE